MSGRKAAGRATAAGVCCAVGRGSTIPRTSAPARAAGTSRATGSGTGVFAFRGRWIEAEASSLDGVGADGGRRSAAQNRLPAPSDRLWGERNPRGAARESAITRARPRLGRRWRWLGRTVRLPTRRSGAGGAFVRPPPSRSAGGATDGATRAGQPPRVPRPGGDCSVCRTGATSGRRAGARHGSATAGQSRSRRPAVEPAPASGPARPPPWTGQRRSARGGREAP